MVAMSIQPTPVVPKFSMSDLRAARASGRKVAMLTCYDYTTARLMSAADVKVLLVGDSAGNVILGHDSTIPVELSFMIQITAAVRRGAPGALLVADMPFGSYGDSTGRGVRNVMKLVKLAGCDCVKIEVGPTHLPLVRRLADSGVAVMAHLGLRPQAVGVLGGYRAQGRTAGSAADIVETARAFEKAGAASILLEAVPAEVAEAVVSGTSIPVIGCGAGPACHGHVVVTHDLVGLTPVRPKFAPLLGDAATPLTAAFSEFVRQVESGQYPAAEHGYRMPAEERNRFLSLQPEAIERV
jgi:3-methyl-2-oxobutanoate hydroxymethyltransferase